MVVFGAPGLQGRKSTVAIAMLKEDLTDKSLPFGVDLLLPQVGEGARKTNKDYTGGTLPELIDIIIEEKASLFICAVGVPPKWAVDKLHAAGIPIMNMIGAVKHASKALDAGVDIICAQGGEGGGHTGDVPTSILLPKVVDAVRGRTSPLTGDPVMVVGAGGIFDGRGLAAALAMGCSGVWVGTRFIASDEAGAGPLHKQRVVTSDYTDTISGERAGGFKTPYAVEFEEKRQETGIKSMASIGIPPFVADVDELEGGSSIGTLQLGEVRTKKEIAEGVELSPLERRKRGVFLTGQAAGAITDILPAAKIRTWSPRLRSSSGWPERCCPPSCDWLQWVLRDHATRVSNKRGEESRGRGEHETVPWPDVKHRRRSEARRAAFEASPSLPGCAGAAPSASLPLCAFRPRWPELRGQAGAELSPAKGPGFRRPDLLSGLPPLRRLEIFRVAGRQRSEFWGGGEVVGRCFRVLCNAGLQWLLGRLWGLPEDFHFFGAGFSS
ncbi:unnamed protein product [Prorocentrum cordatum]|uniref:Nitronate monooxygenase domain-containing protein n=1 Tax=Prorocentrum cordatum TaxID=2364126 RepID=A0ABN9XG45_9DINO|nr:unnamed protein product [Polarella glacialis]